MATFVKGEIVVLPFPFSDLSSSKRRPALVLANLQGDDIILCQITSKNTKDNYAISLENKDLVSGSLALSSNIRPNRLFTADKSLILYTLGKISITKYREVTKSINDLIEI
ncbi:type II toxin-antitoxin system PemK/MazF family toxin [Arcicella rigui]|uniref:Type II toxin-antitoxin system PemK/MazF family toxin n=1 Tax=Arcicella rigui TaxID=797020 RepID=A0ABU5Q5A9_9BACT|nr:type II toxin-antitoxin system PemK/MazF family toxin [Arcicella rigui]MEA5138015.1 type II toxin-antitoxin system PemK/MazF family toxin [Arcicella rigui]